MSKVFVIGDMHGGQAGDTEKLKGFGSDLCKDDVLINLGDFGFIWYHDKHPKFKQDQRFLKELSLKPYTFAFLDGNHENFELIEKSPVVEKWGGLVNEVYPGIFRLRRGEIYWINGKSFFVMGGAMSNSNQKDLNYTGRGRNKKLRNQLSWWAEEIPSEEEFDYGLEKLASVGFKVDYILTHTCSVETMRDMWDILGYVNVERLKDPVSLYLDEIMEKVEFVEWHFGHHHQDVQIDNVFCHYKGKPFLLNA